MRPEKEEQTDWLVWPNDSFHWPGVFILQTDAKSIQCFQKYAKLIENRFSRSKVQLTRVWKLLTIRWNAWHWESHCVFTAGGERVKNARPTQSWARTHIKERMTSQASESTCTTKLCNSKFKRHRNEANLTCKTANKNLYRYMFWSSTFTVKAFNNNKHYCATKQAKIN
jgi:hypothetical protein